MKILVTGGAGFIGSHIVDQCIHSGHEVAIIDNLSTGKEANIHPLATFYLNNLNDPMVQKIVAFEKPEVIIHHAAQSAVTVSLTNPISDADSNIIGTINVLEAARLNGVSKIIYASSAAVYGEPKYLGIDECHPIHPLSPYGISKYVPELYIQTYANLYNLNYTILRYGNVFGERQDPKGEGGVIAIFADKAKREEQLTIFGDGEQTRDFIYVKDVARANLLALTAAHNCILNVGTNQPTSLNQLIEQCQVLLGRKLIVDYKEPRQGDIKHSYMDNRLITSALNWSPEYNLRQGLENLLHYTP